MAKTKTGGGPGANQYGVKGQSTKAPVAVPPFTLLREVINVSATDTDQDEPTPGRRTIPAISLDQLRRDWQPGHEAYEKWTKEKKAIQVNMRILQQREVDRQQRLNNRD